MNFRGEYLLPIYDMPRNLSPSQKTAFLKKRIADAEKLKNDALAFMEKNKELQEKKFALRNELVQQRKIMGALQPSDEEKKLNNDLSAYNTRLEWALQCHNWIESDKKALKRNRSSSKQATPAEIARFTREMHSLFGEPAPRQRKAKKKPQVKKTEAKRAPRKVIPREDLATLKAKADALDGRNRVNQADIKRELKPELDKYKRCAYCETSLKFADSQIDHITPVSKGGLSTPNNCVLVCKKCNLAKRAKTLRRFCLDTGLNYDTVVARLEFGGKFV
jgi:5-methylcytosine-specific restriction endonuclease McrA